MEELSEIERQQMYSRILNNLTELNIASITSGVQGIELPDGEVITNSKEIVDFVNNTSVKLYRKITESITEIRLKTELEPIDAECPECKNTMLVPLVFDYASFFV